MGGITGAIQNQMQQSPQYDPYTASRRPNYMPYGPNQQFYQPIYQPSYSQFSPMGYGQLPFGGFYQPPMMGFGQRFGNQMLQQPQRQNMFGPATDISDQGQADLRLRTPEGVSMHAPYDAPMLSSQPMSQQPTQQQYTPAPTQQANPVVRRIFKGNFSRAFGGQQPSNFPYSVNYGAPMLSPQPIQSQYRPIPYMTQSQLDAQQRAAQSAALAAAVTPAYDYGGGFGDASVGGPDSAAPDSGGYTGPGSVGGVGSPGGEGGIGMGGDSTGEGVFKRGGKVRKQSYGGIDSLLKK